MAESTRKRLLFLITSPAWGGAERYVARLAAEAAKTYDVTVMAGGSSSSPLLAQERAGGIEGLPPLDARGGRGSYSGITPPPFGHLPLHQGEGMLRVALPPEVRYVPLPELVHPIAPLRDLKAVRALKRFLDAEGIDLIHCNSSKAGLVGALAAAFSKRRPKVVYTAHGWGFMEPRSSAFRAAVYLSELLASGVRDATIVVSAKERAIALRWKLASSKKLHLIPHGLEAAELGLLDRAEARRKLGVDGFVIGTIANAYPSKSLPLLIEAFSDVNPQSSNLKPHLVIIGDGPSMHEVRAAREASPAKDRVHLPGAMPKAARLLKGFDLFVLPSVKEGMPWAILEAAAAGLPILATRVGAIPEMLAENETGILVEPGDRRALSDALKKLMADGALRARLASAAARSAAARSAAAMLTRTLDLYGRLLAVR